MKIEYVRSMSLPKGIPVPHFETVKEVLSHLKTGEAGLVELTNLYGRQKDSLPNSKDWFNDLLDGWGFKRQTKDKKPATGAKGEKLESDSDYVDRFVASAVAGQVTAPGLTVTGKDDKEKTASVWAFLQTHVDKVQGGFPMDLNAASRVSGSKKIPAHAIEAAKRIIANGPKRVAEWVKKFASGDVFPDVKIGPIAHGPFDTAVPKGADEATAQATLKTNEDNLARAIAAAFEEKAKKQSESVFA
jgi:hypothetical protein